VAKDLLARHEARLEKVYNQMSVIERSKYQGAIKALKFVVGYKRPSPPKDQTEKEYFPSDIHKIGQELGKIYRDQTKKECENPDCKNGRVEDKRFEDGWRYCEDCKKEDV